MSSIQTRCSLLSLTQLIKLMHVGPRVGWRCRSLAKRALKPTLILHGLQNSLSGLGSSSLTIAHLHFLLLTRDLESTQAHMSLLGNLHLLYTVAPIDRVLSSPVDWQQFMHTVKWGVRGMQRPF